MLLQVTMMVSFPDSLDNSENLPAQPYQTQTITYTVSQLQNYTI